MEEYLEKLLSQIRCKKARPYISDEIRSHIEDQISVHISNGMSSADAVNYPCDYNDSDSQHCCRCYYDGQYADTAYGCNQKRMVSDSSEKNSCNYMVSILSITCGSVTPYVRLPYAESISGSENTWFFICNR